MRYREGGRLDTSSVQDRRGRGGGRGGMGGGNGGGRGGGGGPAVRGERKRGGEG